MSVTTASRGARPAGLVWFAGGAVAAGAGAATAHGLFEVAIASRVPGGIAWIYPLITDGLALVAYAATARLHGAAARYAWAVVVLAAGLSGLAQAAYLAADSSAPPAPDVAPVLLPVDPALRFGVGAWPAIAAALTAHLLYLLAAGSTSTPAPGVPGTPGPVVPAITEPAGPTAQAGRAAHRTALPDRAGGVHPARSTPAPGHPDQISARVQPLPLPNTDRPVSPSAGSAAGRARVAAETHRNAHGVWPTVRALSQAAAVSTGTAQNALRALRSHPEITTRPATHAETTDS